jgi:hypothetical protein
MVIFVFALGVCFVFIFHDLLRFHVYDIVYDTTPKMVEITSSTVQKLDIANHSVKQTPTLSKTVI